jgi:hypothetical protein
VTFSYISPYNLPSDFGGFCCDQVTVYDPTRDLTFWSLAYYPDSNGNDGLCLAMAIGPSGVSSNTWMLWNVTPDMAGFPPCQGVDYPQLALISNYLYLTANILEESKGTTAAVIYWFSLDDLGPPNPSPPFSYMWLDNTLTFTPVSGATTTMYWATQVDSASWGDYLSVRPASGTGNSWVGASFTLQDPCG